MHLLLLGKVPPIQGGVSSATWLACQDIANAGHSIDIMTNADSMSIGFRQMFLPGDDAKLRDTNHGLNLNNVEEIPPLSYIPWAPPYFSQLMSESLRVAFQKRPEAVIGWYLEPYGAVASVIGRLLDVPVVLRHAGSDIGRMRKLGGLTTFYDWALCNAARVLTVSNQPAVEILTEAGVGESAMVHCRGRRLCDSFYAKHERFDLETVVQSSEKWFSKFQFEPETKRALFEWNQASLENECPVIGTYGKIAEVKGTYSLLDALDLLAQKGEKFVYRAIWSATPTRFKQALHRLHQKPALKGRVTIIPPLAPWRIPAFIRSCSAVAFLENRFPIEFHGPQVPREVLACKRPLLLSREIYSKVYFRDQLSDGINVMLIDDPRDVSKMAEKIGHLLNSSETQNCLGHHAGALSRALEVTALQHDAIVDVIGGLGRYEYPTKADG